MKSNSRLECAVFQLTPTRTRCDLYIIAGDTKEKVASGLLKPFVTHLKAAQDQIAQGGYSILLAPPQPEAPWFTKSTLQSFVRFVSNPELLERVYTIESELLQIEEAISIQGNNDISMKDHYVKPVGSIEGNKPACDVDEEKAVVLYKPGAHELTSSSAKERNSKVQLINVLETRKTALKKEQGMAFARAVAAGFENEHVASLLSFAECFGASRLMSACLRFIDLWKQKHESGQWLEIEAAEALSDCYASGIVLSSMTGAMVRGGNAISETAGSNTNASGGEQQYHGGQHQDFPSWGMHSSTQGDVPVFQAYPMPYYPGFYPPPPPYPISPSIEDPSQFRKRHSVENNYRCDNIESEAVNEEESVEQCKSAGKNKSGRVVIRNINFINSKIQTSSVSASDTDDHTQQQKRTSKSNRNNSEYETPNGKIADGGHWDAFQTYLLKSAAEGEREDMFAMEKDPKTKRYEKPMAGYDPLLAPAKHNDDDGGEGHMQSYYISGRKIVYRSANNDDDFIMVGRREETNVRDGNGFEEANLDKRNGLQHDEAVMLSLLSTSCVNDYNSTGGLKMFDLPENKSNKPPHVVKYEPDALSLMPERDVENIGYDPAIDYEMQLAASHEKASKQEKKGSKRAAEKHQLSKPNQGVVRKGRPSKVNNNTKNTLEDARARADKLRSYKADLQKIKKEQQDAEQKRLEALKMERQKRISARTTSFSRKQLPSSKLSPISQLHGSTKFTDSDPGSSSPLQRSKIRPTSTNNLRKPLTGSSKLIDRNHSAAENRMTRSLSSMSDTKKEMSSVITPTDLYKASSSSSSITRIRRRLSEPKNINTTPHTSNTKTRSAKPVSKPKSSDWPTETKQISTPIDQSNAAELNITTSSNLMRPKMKAMVKVPVATTSQVAKLNLNKLSDADDIPVINKTVVMLEHNKKPSSMTTKEFNSNHRTGMNSPDVPLPMETVDKGTISVHPQKHPTTSSEVHVEEGAKKFKAPYARVSSFEDQSTRNSEYAKAPHHQPNFMKNGIEKAYVSSSKGGGGFRRLLKLGKKTLNPPPPPRVNTLRSLIFEDETPTPTPQKSSRRLFSSFQFGGEKKPTS